MWTLYYAPISCALASHIALEQADAACEAVKLDFANNAQRSPESLRVNPKGRVPTLVTERGVLTELRPSSRSSQARPSERPETLVWP